MSVFVSSFERKHKLFSLSLTVKNRKRSFDNSYKRCGPVRYELSRFDRIGPDIASLNSFKYIFVFDPVQVWGFIIFQKIVYFDYFFLYYAWGFCIQMLFSVIYNLLFFCEAFVKIKVSIKSGGSFHYFCPRVNFFSTFCYNFW